MSGMMSSRSRFERVLVLAGLVALAAAAGVGGPAQARPLPQPFESTPRDCTIASFFPGAAQIPVLDPDDEISIDLVLVGDRGISGFRLEEIKSRAEEAYESIGLDLNVVQTLEVEFVGSEPDDLMDQARALFPDGERPKGADAVAVITSINLTSDGQDTVAGQVACVGGVIHPTEAFLVGEDLANRPGGSIMGLSYGLDRAARIFGHELAHLLGAHHHYSNCGEGIAGAATRADSHPCTVMFPTLDGISLVFGALEGTVARGYADRYARP